ncbi:MAG: MFS transporter [Methyloprofundus sp.]|nr:MFS transporter [Methyloprofundus sp.]
MTHVQDITSPMSSLERRATLSLSSIYALRMLGLFMILPVLSLFAETLEGSTPLLIGLAISVYGLTQAILQIPFGLLSDRFGRKKIIVIGLLLFASGSIVAALSTTIYGVLIGRALQGSGAIAAAIMALVADLTQEVHRTKAMAMIGASIGVSFGVAMTIGPVIAGFSGIQGIFWFTAILSFLAVFVVLFVVPNPVQTKVHRDAELDPKQFTKVLKDKDLLRLDYGIFILHLILTATFVIVPLLIRDAGLASAEHWKVYLPVLTTSMAMIIPFVILAEKKRKMKAVFVGAVATLALADLGLFFFNDSLFALIACLWVFFCGFNLLEATLPSLISKTAPGNLKGTAMGAYSSSQFFGAFLGGITGGWIYGEWGASYVFLFCAFAAATWVVVALSMKAPQYLANLLVSTQNIAADKLADFLTDILAVEGVASVDLQASESVAYLKVDNALLDKDKLQYLLTQWSNA